MEGSSKRSSEHGGGSGQGAREVRSRGIDKKKLRKRECCYGFSPPAMLHPDLIEKNCVALKNFDAFKLQVGLFDLRHFSSARSSYLNGLNYLAKSGSL